VAEAEVDGARRLLGVARLTGDGTSHRAEYAVLVGEAWQGKGLGKLLTEYCLRNAHRVQVQEVHGFTQRSNTRMIRVFKRLGFQLDAADDPTLLVATKQLYTSKMPSNTAGDEGP
jgi:acetyltransferase